MSGGLPIYGKNPIWRRAVAVQFQEAAVILCLRRRRQHTISLSPTVPNLQPYRRLSDRGLRPAWAILGLVGGQPSNPIISRTFEGPTLPPSAPSHLSYRSHLQGSVVLLRARTWPSPSSCGHFPLRSSPGSCSFEDPAVFTCRPKPRSGPTPWYSPRWIHTHRGSHGHRSAPTHQPAPSAASRPCPTSQTSTTSSMT